MSDDKTYEPLGENPDPTKQLPKSSSSCILWGCLLMLLLVVFVVVGGGLGAYFWVKGQVNRYTADTAADLPVVAFSEEEFAEVRGRVDNFKETIEAGETPEDLVLTAQELNALITKDENLRGKIYVTIEDGVVAGEVSIPADFLPGGKGRFFNASATFDVSLENGVLIVTLADANFKGEKLPQQFIDAMSKENLAKDMYKDPEMAATLGRIESISIEHDKIVLRPRPATSEDDDTAGEGQKAPQGHSDAAGESTESNSLPGTDAAPPDPFDAANETE